ncbi:alanine--tRNA ligase [Sphaerisporangium sp. TRM90804]|uniref:alanine--tRNA ligase n=1 Tax=Sphaerisporangium sp. TRM90804 TaxID=3031113 RepID=UPI00244CA3DE|nr:alanine--tRNA ligase [Sphaerisporangium sp. TRM90804]MDH2427878.1 alanine--tRNA ligase [Sphaerisporangium sp. TRM90804]
MRSPEIRSTFLGFFTERDHRVVPSASLIPDDPTLLLNSAGMVPFKPYFLGESRPGHSRVTSVQKCVRTSDIDVIGRTARHATCFEMLGNFSFGDYFKQEAVAWSWELLTRGFGLDPSRLWVTVFTGDDETERMWRRVGVPGERVQRLGMEDNYWSMGVPGPCGPSSELHYDRGPAFGREGGPAVDADRYQEIWNLVFMQNLRGEGTGKSDFPVVGELPARNIDTGLGLERLAAILQDVGSLGETDVLAPTLGLVRELAGRPYPGGGEEAVSFQVVADHVRAVTFLVADGVLPARDGRGYVLRRLARRAVRHARLLGIEGPVLPALTGSVVDNLGTAWPELERHRSLIEQVVAAEEEAFGRTLRQGSRLLDEAIGRARSSGSARLPGRAAFRLHDTYGFPIDLTVDAARSAGLTVDRDAFAALLEEQQSRAKQVGRGRKGTAVARQDAYRRVAAEHGLTRFVGYDATTAEVRLVALLDDGRAVPGASEGAELEVVLDRSPFYAEAGGQVGDTGVLRTGDGAVLRVLDTRPGIDGLHVHTARVTSGEVRAGQGAEAVVDAGRRAAVARSHSATHVLHAMLRRVLGPHAEQQGSRVEPGRVRFDFAHFTAVGPERLASVQALVNEHLLDDPEVRVWEATRAEAEAAGATALFGEKYGDRVRIVDIGDFSRELCGGTHVGHGSQAGPVHILGESSIGASLRRVEALTGADALRHHDHERAVLAELAALLEVPADQAPDRLRRRLASLAEARRRLDALREAELSAMADTLASRAQRVGGGWLLTERVDGVTADELRPLATELARRRGDEPGIVVIGADAGGKALLVAALSPGLSGDGLRAGDLLTEAARAVGGGAGGKGALASAGGRHPEHLAKALTLASRAAHTHLTALP